MTCEKANHFHKEHDRIQERLERTYQEHQKQRKERQPFLPDTFNSLKPYKDTGGLRFVLHSKSDYSYRQNPAVSRATVLGLCEPSESLRLDRLPPLPYHRWGNQNRTLKLCARPPKSLVKRAKLATTRESFSTGDLLQASSSEKTMEQFLYRWTKSELDVIGVEEFKKLAPKYLNSLRAAYSTYLQSSRGSSVALEEWLEKLDRTIKERSKDEA